MPEEEFFNRYLRDVGNVYFKVYTYLLTGNTPDYVSGYADLLLPPTGATSTQISKYYGTVSDGTNLYGYVSLKLRDAQGAGTFVDAKLNPFRKAAFDYLKYERSDIAYEMGTGGDFDVLDFFTEFLLPWNSIEDMFLGFDIYSGTPPMNRAEKIFLNGKSVIRLGCGDGKKFGGNGRVRRIQMTDDWEQSGLDEGDYYGQEYTYTIEENGLVISSGVADEPQIYNEDNVLYQPCTYQYSIPLTSNRSTFIEKPIMSSYYPASQVGYRKVTVTTLASNASGGSATSLLPQTIYEFYTSKEFPVYFKQTDISNDSPISISLIIPGISNTFIKRVARSQGYSLTLNDMAGRVHSITTQTIPTATNAIPTVLKRETFEYSTIGDYNPNIDNKLNYNILVLDKTDMKYRKAVAGVNYDLFYEINENKSRDDQFGGDLSLCASFIFPGVPFPMFLPYKGVTETSLRTVVFNKIVYESGILKRHIVEDEESKVTFENLVFDSETADPIITSYDNEFSDEIVKVNFPAHYYYPGMSGAYKNILASGIGASPLNQDGKITLTNASATAFTPGDQIIFSTYHPGELFTVVKTIPGSTIQCIDKNGDYLNTEDLLGTITVVKSGFRNMLTSSAGQIVSKPSSAASFDINEFHEQDFLKTGDDLSILDSVLDASAVEYRNSWQICCSDDPIDLSDGETQRTCSTVVITPELIDLISLFDHLAANHELVTAPEWVIWDQNSALYPNYLTPVLLSAISEGDPTSFKSEEVGSNLEVRFEGCSGKLILYAGGKDFSNIIHLYNPSLLASPVIDDNGDCLDFKCSADVLDPNDGSVSTVTLTGTFPSGFCMTAGYCADPVNSAYASDCSFGPTENVDPYQSGFLGIWRPWKSYVYNTNRTNFSAKRAMQFEGIYKDFSLFNWKNTNCNSNKWIVQNEITRYSPYGFELENKDALKIYSSALYGYCNTLNTAVSSNSKLNEIANDNFEDYDCSAGNLHFSFKDVGAANYLTTTKRHSGLKSLLVASGQSYSLSVPITTTSECEFFHPDCPEEDEANDENLRIVETGVSMEECDCLGDEFSPVLEKKYIISAWVSESYPNSATPVNPLTYSSAEIDVNWNNQTHAFHGTGPIVDGWQRVWEEFTIPAGTTSISVELKAPSSNPGIYCYFDDIRIHPYDSKMSTFVYNSNDYRLMAQLDENNYAVFYIYDEEGKLIEKKVETYNGIQTVEEVRQHIQK